MNLVATAPTRRLLSDMLRTARQDNPGDAVLAHLRDVQPEQLAALVTLLLARALQHSDESLGDLDAIRTRRHSDAERMAHEDAMFTDDEARQAHRRYKKGARDRTAVVGNRVYARRTDPRSPFYRGTRPRVAS